MTETITLAEYRRLAYSLRRIKPLKKMLRQCGLGAPAHRAAGRQTHGAGLTDQYRSMSGVQKDVRQRLGFVGAVGFS